MLKGNPENGLGIVLLLLDSDWRSKECGLPQNKELAEWGQTDQAEGQTQEAEGRTGARRGGRTERDTWRETQCREVGLSERLTERLPQQTGQQI